jgi:SAM-dependent methyltransferase
MPCQSYTDPRLAAVYDTLNPPDTGEAFYRDLTGTVPQRILEIGCGTGRLAVSLAARGHAVTAADPAEAMLEIARARQGGELVHWTPSDAAGLDLTARFDLIVMTGHVFQVFLDDEAVSACLKMAARHLAPDGRLAFETRNPLVQEWEEWIPDLTREDLVLPDGAVVEVHYDIAAVEGDLVTFETHFRFAGEEPRVATSTLRFMDRATLDRLLAVAGLEIIECFGDWDRSPPSESSPEIIIIAGRAEDSQKI